jgi:hypothetical protein
MLPALGARQASDWGGAIACRVGGSSMKSACLAWQRHRFTIWGAGLLGALFMALALVAGGPSVAQTSTDIGGAARMPPEARVEGFRSAKFGMDMDAVRAAIEKDFAITGEAIILGENPIERTQVLSITSPDVLDEGGLARVSYVFGYTSGELIQVGVSWNAEADSSLTEAMVVTNGDILRNHFLNAGYQADTIETGTVLDNGILLFRGADADGRTTVLLLQGQFTNGEAGARVLSPTALALIYTVDPDDPDIFKIKEGDF